MGLMSRSASDASTSLSSLGELVVADSLQPHLRTIDDIRNQVAHEVAMRAIAKGKLYDGKSCAISTSFSSFVVVPENGAGVRTGVCLTFSKSDDELFLRHVGAIIQENLLLQEHLFVVGTTGANSSTQVSPIDSSPNGNPVQTINSLIICGSSFERLDRARLLTGSKFLGRIISATDAMEDKQWIASILDLGVSPYDEDALWDVLRKSVRTPGNPRQPPPGSKGINEILEDSRAHLVRVTPEEAYGELRGNGQRTEEEAPVFLVDIRPVAQREREGGICGSLIIERNMLEWRFDPRSESKLTIADRYDLRVIVFCQEGYTSSLAAYALQRLGLYNATDVIGGLRAWREAGLPVAAWRGT